MFNPMYRVLWKERDNINIKLNPRFYRRFLHMWSFSEAVTFDNGFDMKNQMKVPNTLCSEPMDKMEVNANNGTGKIIEHYPEVVDDSSRNFHVWVPQFVMIRQFVN